MTLSPRGAKRKGSNAEREVVTFLRDHLGDNITRTVAGSSDDRGDVAGLLDMVVQVKNHRSIIKAIGEGMRGVAVQKENARAAWGCVFARRPGGGFYVVMSPEDFVSMYREAYFMRSREWQ